VASFPGLLISQVSYVKDLAQLIFFLIASCVQNIGWTGFIEE
jgi:hypothetical protein